MTPGPHHLMSVRRVATPGKFFASVREMREAAAHDLRQTLPRLTYPYHDPVTLGSADALLELLSAADQTLNGSRSALTEALGRFWTRQSNLPDKPARLYLQAKTMRRTLFSRIQNDDRRAEAYILYALEPGTPDDSTTLQEFHQGWDRVCDEVRAAGQFSLFQTDINKSLPPREPVRCGAKTLRGWNGLIFNHDEGLKAVLEISHAMTQGYKYLQSVPRQPAPCTVTP